MTQPDWFASLRSRHWVLGLSVLGALLLQGAVFPHLTVFGTKPDLMMIVVACWALLYGPQEGFLAGLGAGLLQDVVFGQYVGLFALAKCLAGFGLGVAGGKIFRESVWVSTGAAGVGILVHEVIVWACLRGLGLPAPGLALVTTALPGALYSMILTPLVFRRFLVYRLAEWAREKEMSAAGPGSSPGAARR